MGMALRWSKIFEIVSHSVRYGRYAKIAVIVLKFENLMGFFHRVMQLKDAD